MGEKLTKAQREMLEFIAARPATIRNRRAIPGRKDVLDRLWCADLVTPPVANGGFWGVTPTGRAAIALAERGIDRGEGLGSVGGTSCPPSPSDGQEAVTLEERRGSADDPALTALLDGVVGVVEANSFARHMLWDENRRLGLRTWVEHLAGVGRTVGHVGDRPVFVSLLTATVDDHKLLFIDPTSQVVDHEMVRAWLERTLPRTAFRASGRLNITDAMNFHNVFRPPLQSAAKGQPDGEVTLGEAKGATEQEPASGPSGASELACPRKPSLDEPESHAWRPIETVAFTGDKIMARHRDGSEFAIYAYPEWEPEARRSYTHWRPWTRPLPAPPAEVER